MQNALNDRLEAMIARISKGDRAALESLFDATSAKLHALSVAMLKDRPLAEDNLEQVYVRVWKEAKAFADSGLKPMTWMISLTRSGALSRLRNEAQQKSAAARLPGVVPTISAGATEAAEQSTEDAAKTLQDAQIQALRGAYLEGKGYDALARQNGITPQEARHQLRAALSSISGGGAA